MWEGKTGRIQSFNQTKKFTIMKKVIVIFTVYTVVPCRYTAVSLTRLKHYLKHFSCLNGKFWIRPTWGNPGNFCLQNPKSWALESRIQLKKSGISLTIGIQNPNSRWQTPVSGDRNPRRGIQNPRLPLIPLYGASWIGHFHDDDLWLQLPEFISSLLSYLNLSIPQRFKEQ